MLQIVVDLNRFSYQTSEDALTLSYSTHGGYSYLASSTPRGWVLIAIGARGTEEALDLISPLFGVGKIQPKFGLIEECFLLR